MIVEGGEMLALLLQVWWCLLLIHSQGRPSLTVVLHLEERHFSWHHVLEAKVIFEWKVRSLWHFLIYLHHYMSRTIFCCSRQMTGFQCIPKMWCLLNSYGPLLYMLGLWSIVIQSTLVPIILVGWIIEAWCHIWNGHNRTLFKFWTFGPHYFSSFLFLIWMKIFCTEVCLFHFFVYLEQNRKTVGRIWTLIHP